LLDEPTSALDEKTALRVEALLKDLTANGTGIIMVTHNEQQAHRIAARRYNMSSGQLTEMPV
jgi:ABC-type phosphate transport system ATPase subunit